MEEAMEQFRLLFVVVSIVLGFGLCKAGTGEECPVTAPGNQDQYINVTITLKILLVEFTDVKCRKIPGTNEPLYTELDFEDMLGSENIYRTPRTSPDGTPVYGSMSDYYLAMSNNNVSIDAILLNSLDPETDKPIWLTLPNTKGYYHAFDYTVTPFFTDAIAAATNAGLDVSTGDNIRLAIIYAGNTYYLFKGLNPQSVKANGKYQRYNMGELQHEPGTQPNQENPTDKFSRI
jgi:hypothetical protein